MTCSHCRRFWIALYMYKEDLLWVWIRGSEGSILSSFRSLQSLGHNPSSCWSFCSVDGVIGAAPWESCRNFFSGGGGESFSVGLAAGCFALGVDGSVELGFFCDITLSNREFLSIIKFYIDSLASLAKRLCNARRFVNTGGFLILFFSPSAAFSTWPWMLLGLLDVLLPIRSVWYVHLPAKLPWMRKEDQT